MLTLRPEGDASALAQSSRERPRLLLVDDDAPLRRMLRLLLEDEGFQVTTATDLARACTLLQGQSFDLVLTDSFSAVPGLVLERTAVLRQVAGATPVALVTAHAIQREATLAAGFCALIGKPFDLDSFLGQLHRLVARGEDQRTAVSQTPSDATREPEGGR